MSVSGGYDYYMGQTASPKSMYLPLRWLLAVYPLRPEQWSQPEEALRTPQQLAMGLLHRLLHWTLLPPRIDQWISCTIPI
jgi:hypothetical protein